MRMQTITSMERMVEIGLRVSVLTIKIRMEPAVRFPVRLLSYLAQNCELTDAVIKAKEYISGALADGMDLGREVVRSTMHSAFNPSKN